MRYVSKENAHKVRLSGGSISVTGSVRGMQMRYGSGGSWQRGGQVRIGAWVHAVGVREVDRLRSVGLLQGE